MFTTDFNHLLQSLDFPWLYKFMLFVSFLGSVYMIFLAVIILIAGVEFKKGFLILNIVGWGALVMLGAKNMIDFPRPIAVDITLNSFGLEKTGNDYRDLQPSGFFEVFSSELLKKIRASEIGRYGFPSGHVILITTIWMSAALMFKRRWLALISGLVIFLTAISRMYLGVHYLGDTLGGFVIGSALTLGSMALFGKLQLLERLKIERNKLMIFLLPLFLLLLSSTVPSFQAGTLIGFNLAFLVIFWLKGMPQLDHSLLKRVVNTLLFVVVFFASFFLTKQLQLPKYGAVSMASFAIINFGVVMVFFYIGYWLKLYIPIKDEQIS